MNLQLLEQNTTKSKRIYNHNGEIQLYSYNSLIATIDKDNNLTLTNYYAYSSTTAKHRGQFLRDYDWNNKDEVKYQSAKGLEKAIKQGLIQYKGV